MGLADKSAAAQYQREATCQQGQPCDNPKDCPDPKGCGFVTDETIETLKALESAIRTCQEQANRWRDLAGVYARYHADLCHGPR
jgi:hypothetical protein